MNRFVEFISSENESLTSKDEGCGKQVLLELDVSNSVGIASLKVIINPISLHEISRICDISLFVHSDMI